MKIIYLSYTKPDYTLNAVCIKGLLEIDIDVADHHIKSRGVAGFMSALSFYRHNSKNTDIVFVGYDSPALVILLRLFCRKKIVYNAFLSVYERVIVSRKLASRFSIKAIYCWLLDFLAVHFANLTRLESNSQTEYFKKLFKVSGNKLCRGWVGVDEDKFFYDPKTDKFDIFTVLFRGALMPEAGTEYIIKAAKILEDKNIKLIMIGGGTLLGEIQKLLSELKPANIKHVTDYVPYDQLRETMQRCHLSLGQLSNHDRLTRTTPLKMFESLAMKLPYLTAPYKAILELLTPDKTCLVCDPADPEALAEKILWAKNNYSFTERIAENGYRLYQDKLRLKVIAEELIKKIINL